MKKSRVEGQCGYERKNQRRFRLKIYELVRTYEVSERGMFNLKIAQVRCEGCTCV